MKLAIGAVLILVIIVILCLYNRSSEKEILESFDSCGRAPTGNLDCPPTPGQDTVCVATDDGKAKGIDDATCDATCKGKDALPFWPCGQSFCQNMSYDDYIKSDRPSHLPKLPKGKKTTFDNEPDIIDLSCQNAGQDCINNCCAVDSGCDPCGSTAEISETCGSIDLMNKNNYTLNTDNIDDFMKYSCKVPESATLEDGAPFPSKYVWKPFMDTAEEEVNNSARNWCHGQNMHFDLSTQQGIDGNSLMRYKPVQCPGNWSEDSPDIAAEKGQDGTGCPRPGYDCKEQQEIIDKYKGDDNWAGWATTTYVGGDPQFCGGNIPHLDETGNFKYSGTEPTKDSKVTEDWAKYRLAAIPWPNICKEYGKVDGNKRGTKVGYKTRYGSKQGLCWEAQQLKGGFDIVNKIDIKDGGRCDPSNDKKCLPLHSPNLLAEPKNPKSYVFQAGTGCGGNCHKNTSINKDLGPKNKKGKKETLYLPASGYCPKNLDLHNCPKIGGGDTGTIPSFCGAPVTGADWHINYATDEEGKCIPCYWDSCTDCLDANKQPIMIDGQKTACWQDGQGKMTLDNLGYVCSEVPPFPEECPGSEYVSAKVPSAQTQQAWNLGVPIRQVYVSNYAGVLASQLYQDMCKLTDIGINSLSLAFLSPGDFTQNKDNNFDGTGQGDYETIKQIVINFNYALQKNQKPGIIYVSYGGANNKSSGWGPNEFFKPESATYLAKLCHQVHQDLQAETKKNKGVKKLCYLGIDIDIEPDPYFGEKGCMYGPSNPFYQTLGKWLNNIRVYQNKIKDSSFYIPIQLDSFSSVRTDFRDAITYCHESSPAWRTQTTKYGNFDYLGMMVGNNRSPLFPSFWRDQKLPDDTNTFPQTNKVLNFWGYPQPNLWQTSKDHDKALYKWMKENYVGSSLWSWDSVAMPDIQRQIVIRNLTSLCNCTHNPSKDKKQEKCVVPGIADCGPHPGTTCPEENYQCKAYCDPKSDTPITIGCPCAVPGSSPGSGTCCGPPGTPTPPTPAPSCPPDCEKCFNVNLGCVDKGKTACDGYGPTFIWCGKETPTPAPTPVSPTPPTPPTPPTCKVTSDGLVNGTSLENCQTCYKHNTSAYWGCFDGRGDYTPEGYHKPLLCSEACYTPPPAPTPAGPTPSPTTPTPQPTPQPTPRPTPTPTPGPRPTPQPTPQPTPRPTPTPTPGPRPTPQPTTPPPTTPPTPSGKCEKKPGIHLLANCNKKTTKDDCDNYQRFGKKPCTWKPSTTQQHQQHTQHHPQHHTQHHTQHHPQHPSHHKKEHFVAPVSSNGSDSCNLNQSAASDWCVKNHDKIKNLCECAPTPPQPMNMYSCQARAARHYEPYCSKHKSKTSCDLHLRCKWAPVPHKEHFTSRGKFMPYSQTEAKKWSFGQM